MRHISHTYTILSCAAVLMPSFWLSAIRRASSSRSPGNDLVVSSAEGGTDPYSVFLVEDHGDQGILSSSDGCGDITPAFVMVVSGRMVIVQVQPPVVGGCQK